jgi:beclin 1
MQVDQPMCVECTRALCEELDQETAEAERETAAYEACLARLAGEPEEALSEEEFEKEVKRVRGVCCRFNMV